MIDCKEAIRMMRKTSCEVESILKIARPDLLNVFYTYSNEAIQARRILNTDLLNLNYGDSVLEVGAGILALATQLSREGFKVTAVEPVQDGFEEINFIMDQYLTLCQNEKIYFELIKSKIESYNFTKKYNYIFAFNVLEHVENPYTVVKKLSSKLEANCNMRIICPNYDFPYEPHFNRVLIRRKNKAFFGTYKSLIRREDADSITLELYKSLNFVSYKKLLLYFAKNNIYYIANKDAFYEIILRSLNDKLLANRHPKMYKFIKILVFFNLYKLVKIFPFKFSPIIDLTIINKI
jgi:hypothetical protein